MKALLLTCLIAFSISSQAIERPENGPLTVYEQLRKHVKFSSYSQKYQLEGKVFVRFIVDEFHVVRIRVISGTHKRLIYHVRKKLQNKEVFGQNIQAFKEYEMTFTYYPPYRLGGRSGVKPLR